MAERKVDIIISAHDAFTSTLSKAQAGFQSFADSVKGKAEQLVNLKTVSIAAGAALAGLGYEMIKAIEAASESEAAEKRLTTALGYRSQALLDQAGALQKTTAFGDDQIVQAQAAIAAFTRDETAIKSLTKATLDFAAAKGMDLASAGDLVAKSFGSSTDALSRYGIEVNAAAGSAGRLKQITEGLSAHFGGQASAAAQSFAGRIAQAGNAFNDLQEEVGFLITKNPVVIKAVELVTRQFESLSGWVNENRLSLMSYVKDGVLLFVAGIGTAVEVMRFFHNGWLGLKLAGQAVSLSLVDSINWIYMSLRLVLLPLDLLYEGMVKLKVVEFNPFDKAQKAIEQYRGAVIDVGAGMLSDIEETNAGYDDARDAITKMGNALAGVVLMQEKMAAGGKNPLIAGPKGATLEELQKLAEAQGKYNNALAQSEFNAAKRRADVDLAMLQEKHRLGLISTQEYNAASFALEDEKSAQYVDAIRKEMAAEDELAIKKITQLQQYQASSEAVLAVALDHAEKMVALNGKISESDSNATVRHIENKKGEADADISYWQTAGSVAAQGAALTMNAYNMMGKKHKELFYISKALAIAEAIINANLGAAKALGQGGILGIPFSSLILGMGYANAAMIAATTFMGEGGSGGSTGAGGSGGSIYPGMTQSSYPMPERVSQDSRPVQNVNVYIQNGHGTAEYWGKLVEENIVPALNSSAERKVFINVGA